MQIPRPGLSDSSQGWGVLGEGACRGGAGRAPVQGPPVERASGGAAGEGAEVLSKDLGVATQRDVEQVWGLGWSCGHGRCTLEGCGEVRDFCRVMGEVGTRQGWILQAVQERASLPRQQRAYSPSAWGTCC